MKAMKNVMLLFALIVLSGFTLGAQQYQKGMTVGGATGLFVIPTGRIGWEKSAFAFDVGYSGLFTNGFKDYGNVTKANFSFIKLFEIGVAWDAEMFSNSTTYHNVLISTKFQAFKNQSTSLAVGGNLQINGINTTAQDTMAGQIYVAATYSGKFFEWPASSTLFLGKSFYNPINWDFDFGMGFELALFPKTLKEHVALIIELGNFSYAVAGWANRGLDSGSRGLANVGLRIDPIKGKNYKLGIDIIGTDLFDTNRSLGLQACFGLAL